MLFCQASCLYKTVYQAYCVFRLSSLMLVQNSTMIFYKYIPLITLKVRFATLFKRGDAFFKVGSKGHISKRT